MLWLLPFALKAFALPQLINGEGQKFQYPPGQLEEVHIIPDGNYHPFWFGESNTWAFQSFIIRSLVQFKVIVYDCFCPGDSFILYNNGDSLLEVAQDCTPGDETCPFYQRDPYLCSFPSSGWCRADAFLSAGYYNLTLLVTDSPFGYGQAYLKALL